MRRVIGCPPATPTCGPREYYRQSYFFLRGDLDDQRSRRLWGPGSGVRGGDSVARSHARRSFGALPGNDSRLLLRPGRLRDAPRPTVVVPCGYDSTADLFGVTDGRRARIQRVTFEGPGQGGVLYRQRRYSPRHRQVVCRRWSTGCRPARGPDPAAGSCSSGRSFASYIVAPGGSVRARVAAIVSTRRSRGWPTGSRRASPAPSRPARRQRPDAVLSQPRRVLRGPHGHARADTDARTTSPSCAGTPWWTVGDP